MHIVLIEHILVVGKSIILLISWFLQESHVRIYIYYDGPFSLNCILAIFSNLLHRLLTFLNKIHFEEIIFLELL